MNSALGSTSELRPHPHPEYRRRATVAIVPRVGDELIVKRHAPERYGEAVIHLDDLLRTVIRKFSIAEEQAETAGIEIGAMSIRDAVDDAGDAERIVRSPPSVAFEREP